MIEKTKPRQKYGYNYSELIDAAKAEPGEWFRDDSPDVPKITAHDIRHGSPRAFAPAGSFDAVVRKDGLYVRFLGVPVYPWMWLLGDPREFRTLERTTDPDLYPDENVKWSIDIATRLAAPEMTLSKLVEEILAAKPEKKADARKAKKSKGGESDE